MDFTHWYRSPHAVDECTIQSRKTKSPRPDNRTQTERFLEKEGAKTHTDMYCKGYNLRFLVLPITHTKGAAEEKLVASPLELFSQAVLTPGLKFEPKRRATPSVFSYIK